MKYLIDECTDKAVVIALVEAGHDVICLSDIQPGSEDIGVLRQAYAERRFVVTVDKDFGELVFRDMESHNGVLLIRLHGLSPRRKVERIVETLETRMPDLLGKFSVLSPHDIRIRDSLQTTRETEGNA